MPTTQWGAHRFTRGRGARISAIGRAHPRAAEIQSSRRRAAEPETPHSAADNRRGDLWVTEYVLTYDEPAVLSREHHGAPRWEGGPRDQYFGDPFEPGFRARNGSSGCPKPWPRKKSPSAARRWELPVDTASLARVSHWKVLVRELPDGVASARISRRRRRWYVHRGMTQRNRLVVSRVLARLHLFPTATQHAECLERDARQRRRRLDQRRLKPPRRPRSARMRRLFLRWKNSSHCLEGSIPGD